MNAYRIKIGKIYRFGYQQDGSEHTHFTSSRHVGDQDAIELQHRKLKQLQLDYPDYTFWIEEYNPDNQTWSKLAKNSMYALFSEDEPEEEKAPVQQDIPF